jgi:hypothetical protein
MLAVSFWSVQRVWKESLSMVLIATWYVTCLVWGAEGATWQRASGLSLEASRGSEFLRDVFRFLKLKMALKRRCSVAPWFKQHCGIHLLSCRPCTAQNALSNTVVAGLAVTSPKDSTLEQTTFKWRQVLLQGNIFSLETVWSHRMCMYDAWIL